MIDHLQKESIEEKLLFYASLLAGLGGSGTALVEELRLDEADDLATSERARTCIDAGNTLMFSVFAPGERSLRVLSRLPGRTDEPNVGCWLRIHRNAQGKVERWRTQTFLEEEAVVWKYALDMAQSVDGEEQFRSLHAILGTRGRIYEITSSLHMEQPCGWIGWQIDRRCSPEEALLACEEREAWRIATPPFEQMLGHSISPRYGPWSIAWTLDRKQPRLRIGTSSWARSREDDAKRKRLVAAVASMGGDARFAEALYKLIDAERLEGSPSRIGRAIEIEFCKGRMQAIECYLCVPGKERTNV